MHNYNVMLDNRLGSETKQELSETKQRQSHQDVKITSFLFTF